MTFSKSFPRSVKGSNYTKWEEASITEDEERIEEERARDENLILMNECIRDAKAVMEKNMLKKFQSDMIKVAVALFEKRASHVVYFKEEKCKENLERAGK